MALQQDAVEKCRRAFSNHRTWTSSTGSLHACSKRPCAWGGVGLGWLSRKYADSLWQGTYVVSSYDTPIGWAIEDPETGLFERVIPDVTHSKTTTNHQTQLRVAWADSYHDGTPKGREAWLAKRRKNAQG